MGGREWAGGVSSLLEAVKKGHPRHVQLLLEAGVPVNGSDDTGLTALVTAVLHCQEDRLRERLLRLLLQAGADPNVGDARGTTPLMHAAITNTPHAAIVLLQHGGVDPGVQDGDGNSALMYAAAFGHREIVLLILAAFRQLHHVAFQGQRNGQGLTAWQLADKNGHEDIAALLKVETGVFPRPSGPSTFVPAHPLDLDRPPTPTETRSIRSSSIRRNKPCGKVHAAPSAGPGPTDPLPPPSQILHCNDCHRVVAPRRKRSIRASLEADGTFKREKGARVCVCSEAEDSEAEDVLGRDASAKWDVQDTKIPPSRTSSSHNTEIGLTSDHHTSKGATVQSGVHTSRVGVAGLSSTYTGKGAIGLASDNTFKGATGLITGPISKGVTGLSSGNASKDATGLISNLATKSVTGVSSTRLPKDTTEVSSGSVTKASADESSDNCPTASARGARGLGVRSIIGWGKNLDFAERRRSEGEAGDRSRARSEPVRIGPPDQEERRVLEELMRGLNVSCSPGSGEAPTYSLLRPSRHRDRHTLPPIRHELK